MSYKVLIFSDTHGHFHEIPYISTHNEYDYFIYLGDGYEEVERWVHKNSLSEKFFAVTGNCDFAPSVSRQKLLEIDSVKIFITHGDIYHVKTKYDYILQKAKEINADIAMFGHTHYADHMFTEGVHLFNPGSILPRGRSFCSVGYLEIHESKIISLEHLTF